MKDIKVGSPVEWTVPPCGCGSHAPRQGMTVAIIKPGDDSLQRLSEIETRYNAVLFAGGYMPCDTTVCAVMVPGDTVGEPGRIFLSPAEHLREVDPNSVTWAIKYFMREDQPEARSEAEAEEFEEFSWDIVPKHDRYLRYFVMYGDVCKRDRGFRTKREAEAWMEKFGNRIIHQDATELSCMLDDPQSLEIRIVDRNGKTCLR